MWNVFNKNREAHGMDSCCGGGHSHHKHETDFAEGNKYQCPMKCEGSKTYDVPGNCPVCNMKLLPVT